MVASTCNLQVRFREEMHDLTNQLQIEALQLEARHCAIMCDATNELIASRILDKHGVLSQTKSQ